MIEDANQYFFQEISAESAKQITDYRENLIRAQEVPLQEAKALYSMLFSVIGTRFPNLDDHSKKSMAGHIIYDLCGSETHDKVFEIENSVVWQIGDIENKLTLD